MLWETELPALQGTSLHCFASTSTEKNHRRSATVEPKGVRGALVVFHCRGGHCSNCSELHRSCRNVCTIVQWSACFTTRLYVKYFDYCSARYNNLESSLFFIESLDCILYKSTMDNGLSCRTNAMRRMYGSEAHGLHRLITQRVFIVSLTVYKMNSDDKANGNDNRSVSSWQFRKWITMTNNLCQFAFVIIRAICKIDVVDQIDQILVNVCCIDLRCYFV